MLSLTEIRALLHITFTNQWFSEGAYCTLHFKHRLHVCKLRSCSRFTRSVLTVKRFQCSLKWWICNVTVTAELNSSNCNMSGGSRWTIRPIIPIPPSLLPQLASNKNSNCKNLFVCENRALAWIICHKNQPYLISLSIETKY